MKALKINTVSELIKITTDAIRFYEKKKIIEPQRSPDSNYRLFSLTEIRKLNDCKNFRNLGFSLEEIEYIMHQATAQEMQEMMKKREKEIEDTITESQLALDRIREIAQANENYIKQIGNYTVLTTEEEVVFWYGLKDNINEKVLKSKAYSKVMEFQNLFKCTMRIPFNRLLSNDDREFDYGLSILKSVADKWMIITEEPAEILKPRQCVYTMVESRDVLTVDNLKPIFDWMHDHNFMIDGDIIAKVVDVNFDVGQESRRYDIWVPCR